jgi:hypothetical protein
MIPVSGTIHHDKLIIDLKFFSEAHQCLDEGVGILIRRCYDTQGGLGSNHLKHRYQSLPERGTLR